MQAYLIDRLAEFCCGTRYDMLPAQVVHQAKRCVLDVMGCGIGAMSFGCDRAILEYVTQRGGRPDAHLWTTPTRVPADMAALANGTIAHHLELDDGSGAGASVHPGISVIPAALAVAEATGASGQDFLLAVVLGYEVCIRAGLAAAPGVREHNVHGPGMIGPLGAAAAAASLFKLSVPQTAAALAIAGAILPVAPFESFVEGATTKDIYGGWSGLCGIMAAELAARGMNGPHRLFEGKRSFGALLYHGKPPDLAKALDGLGSRFMISETAFKAFAACRSVQPTVTAVLEMQRQHGFDADEVAQVEVETYPFAAELSNDTTTATPISARLSIPYAVATALKTGALNPQAFLAPGFRDADTLRLAEHVHVKSVEEYGRGPFGARGSIVTILLKNGDKLTLQASHTRWDKDVPPSDDELAAKFAQLARPFIGAARSDELVAAIWQLDRMDRAGKLPELISGQGDASI